MGPKSGPWASKGDSIGTFRYMVGIEGSQGSGPMQGAHGFNPSYKIMGLFGVRLEDARSTNQLVV